MAASDNQPRRRPLSPSVDSLTESMKTISLRKGSTYQVSPKQESELLDTLLKGQPFPSLPGRSATCPKALEDLLIGAGERRTTELLQRVDEAIAKRTELSSILREPEVLPVPSFMLEKASIPSSRSDRSENMQSLQDDKDSGIGSSIETSASDKLSTMKAENDSLSSVSTISAITRSFSGDDEASQRSLSEFAQRQVHKFLLQPLLSEASLQEFHPLVRGVPKRIISREIGTLRDLEKTLIFLAPDYSRSPAAYRSFCESSIRCLHLTVNNVHDSDRCLPTDRPYSTNYFLDLVEQIRRYASILAATREKQAKGEELDEMDALPSDRLELQGGVSHNGKPAFLARTRDSKHISLADGQPLTSEDVAAASVKRPMMDVNTDDDGARRSMARRKKNEPIRTYYCKHDGCTKQFKRPCDLTKHVKTHERPFKCPETDCKYYEIGWPTEKECERHVNDKHSDTPTMYKCLAPGCPYTSKRESNCKQHMEKAHDIPYVRSKNNGKGKAPANPSSKLSPMSKPESSINSPFSPPALSPSTNSTSSPESTMAGAGTGFPDAPMIDFADFNPDFLSHFNTDYLNASPSLPITPSWSEDLQTSATTSVSTHSPFDMPMEDFDNSILKVENYDFGMFGEHAFQQQTPESLFSEVKPAPFEQSQQAGANTGMTNISLNGQTYGFGDYFNDAMNSPNDAFGEDFQLYASNAGSSNAQPNTVSTQAPVYQESRSLENMGSQFFSSASQGQTDLLTLFPELADPQ